jgi:hypothetical protein
VLTQGESRVPIIRIHREKFNGRTAKPSVQDPHPWPSELIMLIYSESLEQIVLTRLILEVISNSIIAICKNNNATGISAKAKMRACYRLPLNLATMPCSGLFSERVAKEQAEPVVLASSTSTGAKPYMTFGCKGSSV